MARRRKHLVVALVVLAVCLGGGTAYAAWSATTATPTSTFTSKADWTAPAVSNTVIHKASTGSKQGYLNGAVKTSGQYFVYANVTDSGNPASGFAASNPVTANLTNLGGSATGALTSGSCSSQGVSYNWCGGPFTVSAGTTAGAKTYTITTADAAGNTTPTPLTTYPVTVDNTKPLASNIQATNKASGTAGKAEQGDTITLTWNEAIDPASIVAGWDGSAMSMTVRGVKGTGSTGDTIELWTANTGGTQITSLGTITLPNAKGSYFSANVNFGSSSMTLSGPGYTTLTLTLGTPDVPANLVTTANAGQISWGNGTTVYDAAGNTIATATKAGTSGVVF